MITPDVAQVNEDISKHYNDLDALYRQVWGLHLHHGFWKTGKESSEEAVVNLIELVAEYAQAKPEMNLCDIGCGYGETSRYFAREKKVNVSAFTISEAQFNYSQSLPKSSRDPSYFLCDWHQNKLPSNQFDAAISIESSEHMENKPLFFQEAYRILRPGGRMVICAWLSKLDPNSFEKKYLLKPICKEGCLPSMGSEKDYRNWFKKAGFEAVQCLNLTQNVKKTWSLCSQRVLKNLILDPQFRKTILDPKFQHRSFMKTILRIWVAYQFKSMQYGLFSAVKPI